MIRTEMYFQIINFFIIFLIIQPKIRSILSELNCDFDSNYDKCQIDSYCKDIKSVSWCTNEWCYCSTSESLQDNFFQSSSKVEHYNITSEQRTNVAPKSLLNDISNVKSMTIFDTELTNILAPKLFKPVRNLRELKLIRNNLTNLEDDVFINVPDLQSLMINCNQLINLTSGIFEPIPNLYLLYLSSNSIAYLPHDVFRNLTHLLVLDLSRNKLKSINDGTFSDNKMLKILDLSFNQLTILDDGFLRIVFLACLNAASNRITSFNTENPYPVQILDLSNNPLNSFAIRGLTMLSMNRLILRNSSLTEFPNIVYNDGLWDWEEKNLKTIDLSYNEIHELKITVEDLLLGLNVTAKNNETVSINLKNNRIKQIDFFYPSLWSETKYQEESYEKFEESYYKVFRIDLEYNPIICNCTTYNLIRNHNKIQTYQKRCLEILNLDKIYCSNEDFKNTLLINLNLDYLNCSLKDYVSYQKYLNSLLGESKYLKAKKIGFTECSRGCNCLFRPINNTVIMECNNLTVNKLPERLPQAEFIENFELLFLNNELTSVEKINPLIRNNNVTKLSLAHNKLSSIDHLELPQTLQVLELDNNNFSVLSKNATEKLNELQNLTYLTLHNNFWQCNCEALEFWYFVKAKYKRIPQLQNVTCTNNNRKLLELTGNDLCKAPVNLLGTFLNDYPFALATIPILFLICIGIIGRYYWLYKKEQKENKYIKKIIVEKQTASCDNLEEPLAMPLVRIEKQKVSSTRKSSSIVPSPSSSTEPGPSSSTVPEYELPMDDFWEFPRDRLQLGKILGEGNFGKVVKAKAFSIKEKNVASIVAVKMLKDNHTDTDMIDLVSEMEIMKIIGNHKNILNLLGCCTQNDKLLVIIEYAQHGNLQDFLRQHQPESGYEKLTGNSTKTLSQTRLAFFAYQIAEGMAYLASRRCIHRDLAARNILVSENYVMKIADFGLARDIKEKNYYRKKKNSPVPVKWMAPEALIHRLYTTKSDVWSFGILFWEIMTFGGTPYPTVDVENLFRFLQSGVRMEKPAYCSDEMYMLMRQCWCYSPDERPPFSLIVDDLHHIMYKTPSNELNEFGLRVPTPPYTDEED